MMRLLSLAGLMAAVAPQAWAFSLVGTWDCGPVKEPGFELSAGLMYKSNGRSTHVMNAAGGREDEHLNIRLKVWGTWSLSGNVLDERIERHKLVSVHINGQRIKAGPEWDDIAADLAESFSGADEEDPVEIQVISDAAFNYVDDDFIFPCTKRGSDLSS